MRISDKYEKLLEYIYDDYENNETSRSYGVYASLIVTQFERNKRIDLGGPKSHLEAIRYLYQNGWIRKNTKNIYTSTKIKPSPEGIRHVEDRRSHAKTFIKTAGNVAEIIGRGLKGFFGR